MALSSIERETIITLNAAEGTAEVFTLDPVYVRKLDKLCEREPDSYKLVKRDGEAAYYTMPKRLLSFRTPTTRELSDEQREALAARMRSMRARVND